MTCSLTSVVLATLGTWLIWEMLHTGVRRLPDWLDTVLAGTIGLGLLMAWPPVRYGLGIAGAVAMVRIVLARR